MSDLTGKFGDTRTQIATQHTEIMQALTSIQNALGAPPATPTATLDTLAGLLTSIYNVLVATRADMNSQLTAIFNTADLINSNNALNAQRLYAFLLATTCPCDPNAPLLDPPLDTTPTTATNTAKCQRIQYFLDLYRSWVITVAQYVGDHGSISSFQVNNLLGITLGNVGINAGQLDAGIPTSTRDLISAQLAAGVASMGASSANAALFQALASSTMDGLRQALYGATTAEGGSAAAQTAIDGMGLGTFQAGVLKTMFWSGWANDMYSDVPVVDASAYSGSVCNPIVCAQNTNTMFSSGQYQATWDDTDLAPFIAPDTPSTSALDLRLATYAITVQSAPNTVHCVRFGGASGFIDTFGDQNITDPAGHIWLYIWCEGNFTVQVCATPIPS